MIYTPCGGNNQRKTIYRSVLVAAILAGLGFQSAMAKDGDLDVGFGDSGHRIIQFDLGNGNGDFASAIAVDGDGRIVVSGTVSSASYVNELAAARLEADGSLDTTFDGKGDGTLHSPGPDEVPAGASSVTLFPDGGFCLAGFAFDTMASLQRGHTPCLLNGGNTASIDIAKVVGEPLRWDASTVPDEDGGFFVVGTAGTGNDSDVYVTRLIDTGTGIAPDLNFYSGTGQLRVIPPFSQPYPETARAATRVVGGVYVAGDVFLGGNSDFLATDRDFLLVAVADDGSFEVTTVPFDLPDSNDDDRAVAVGQDIAGRILLAGIATADAEGENREIALARLLSPSSADLDPNFGPYGNGKRIYHFDSAHPEKDETLSGMVVDEFGRIYLVGTLYHDDGAANPSDIAVMRLTPDGDLDPTFGIDGTTLLPAPATSTGGERGVAIAMQDDRPVVLGEFDAGGTDTGFVVYRLESTVPSLFANGFE